MKYLWIDIDDRTGKYTVPEGEEPRELTEEQITSDERFGTQAMIVEFSDDLREASCGYYDQMMTATVKRNARRNSRAA